MAAEPQLTASNLSLFGSVSPDGLLISYTNSAGDLILRETLSGKEDQLTVRFANAREHVGPSVMARDSRWIAYTFANEDGVLDLRVIEIDSIDARVVYRDEKVKRLMPLAWTADRAQVLALIDDDAVLVPVKEEGEPKRLCSFGGRKVSQVAMSPDGKFLVHDAGGTVVRVELATGKEQVVAEGGILPVFSPDGSAVFFQRDGKLWRVAMADQTAKVEREGFAPARPWSLTDRGDLFYTVLAEKTEIFVLAADRTGPPVRVETRFAGLNRNPVWGPDGRLAYLSRRPQEKWAVVVRDLSNNEEREHLLKLPEIDWLGWSGKSLLVAGLDAKAAKRGWYRVDPGSGSAHEVFAENEFAGERAGAAFLTADGRTFIYGRNGEVRERDLNKRSERRIAPGKIFAVSPNGRSVAVAGAARVVIHGGANYADTVNVELPGITELAWGGQLLAGKLPQVWAIDPVKGTAQEIRMPRNRLPGVSSHPAGERIAAAFGQTVADLYSVRVALK